jgi:hypothetical protein
MAAGSHDAEVCAMQEKPEESHGNELPSCVTEFIRRVTKKMRYRRKVRQDVQTELTAHFEDELRDVTDPAEREKRAKRLIEEFGDAGLLAALCRRAKERCRPLWAQAFVRAGQGAGVCLLLFAAYLVWFFNGQPNARIDYLAVLNQMSRPEVLERDNAWPQYQKAIELFVEPGAGLADVPGVTVLRSQLSDIEGLSPETRQALVDWVEANDAAWEQFKIAAGKPYCYRPYTYADGVGEQPWLLSVTLPHLKPLRQIASVGQWRLRMEVRQGRVAEALEDCLAIARAGRHWQDSKFLVEELLGLGLSGIGHREILQIVSQHPLPAADLARLQRRVNEVYPGAFPLMNVEGERIVFLDTVQHLFTDSGPGGGHLVPDAGLIAATKGDGSLESVDGMLWNALAVVHAGRDRTVAKACELFALQSEAAKRTPYENRGGKGADVVLASLSKRYYVVDVLAPAIGRAAEWAFRGRAVHEATSTILALLRYRANKGSYPASLDELKHAGYIEVLPRDPYSDGPLLYKTVDDGVTLYSVGPNFKDDGGQPGKDKTGRLETWDPEADAVFWPVNP